MKDEIYKKIRVDKDLRRKIADALGVQTETIYRHAINKAVMLKRPLVVEFIAKELGKTVSEISE